MKKLDIIVPCYNEEKCIKLFYQAVSKVFEQISKYDFSIIFINDGSKDHTLKEIKKLAEEYGNEKVRYISFTRNFGKEPAIYAGLEHATGDYVVLMDADLQHPPELLVKMLENMEQGYDCCGARRVNRKGEGAIRSFLSGIFYSAINRISALSLVPGGSDYRMMTGQLAKAMISLEERDRFTKGIFSWVGGETIWIEYENVERAAGETKWSLRGLCKYAISGFMAFATTPLRAAVYLGICVDIAAAVYALVIFFGVLNGSSERTGFATIVLLILFLGGTIILLLGIIGEYLARIYIEMKHRPIYLMKESNLHDEVFQKRGQ